MMELDSFLENYSNFGFNPYIVVSDNKPIPVETNENLLQVLNINHEFAQGYIKKKRLNIQENSWKDYSGYFIRVNEGNVSSVQTCFLTSQDGLEQRVQNVIVVEDNAQLDVFTGCLSNSHVKGNVHNAIVDMFVGKNAKLTFNMIHSWGESSKVYPKTRIYVDQGGTVISNYIVWDKVKEIVANPKVHLKKNAKAVMQTLSYVHKESNLDLGGNLYLDGENSSGEILSSVVSNGGTFKTESIIEGIGNGSKGHIECNALLLNDGGNVSAIPQLISKNSDTQLSHEAYLGKISNEEIEYLQTKGISESKAQEIIVKGFANKSLENMPDTVKSKMSEILENAKNGF